MYLINKYILIQRDSQQLYHINIQNREKMYDMNVFFDLGNSHRINKLNTFLQCLRGWFGGQLLKIKRRNLYFICKNNVKMFVHRTYAQKT